MANRTVTILFALASLVSTLAFAQGGDPKWNPPSITFADLNRSDLANGPFRIEGIVIDIHKCPPCPPGAQCKPCLGDYLTIMDNPDEQDPALRKWLRVFTTVPELEKLAVAKRYSFLVKVRGTIHEGKPVQDVELIGFAPLGTEPKP